MLMEQKKESVPQYVECLHREFCCDRQPVGLADSVNLLSFSSSEESIMRFESSELAVELEEIIK
jgi:hypothetical protein